VAGSPTDLCGVYILWCADFLLQQQTIEGRFTDFCVKNGIFLIDEPQRPIRLRGKWVLQNGGTGPHSLGSFRYQDLESLSADAYARQFPKSSIPSALILLDFDNSTEVVFGSVGLVF
jgi:hypothetical protein